MKYYLLFLKANGNRTVIADSAPTFKDETVKWKTDKKAREYKLKPEEAVRIMPVIEKAVEDAAAFGIPMEDDS